MIKHSLKIIFSFSFLLFVIISCSNSDTSKSIDNLPPGTANISGNISSIQKVENGSIYQIVLTKINKLGQGSPMLVKGDKIDVRIPKSYLDKFSSDKIVVGKDLNLIIKSYEAVGGLRYWEVLEYLGKGN